MEQEYVTKIQEEEYLDWVSRKYDNYSEQEMNDMHNLHNLTNKDQDDYYKSKDEIYNQHVIDELLVIDPEMEARICEIIKKYVPMEVNHDLS